MEVSDRHLSRMVVAPAIRVLLSVEELPLGVGSNSSAGCGGRMDLLEWTRQGAESAPPKTWQSIVHRGSDVGTIKIQAGRRPPWRWKEDGVGGPMPPAETFVGDRRTVTTDKEATKGSSK
jgi:hypothetical protein